MKFVVISKLRALQLRAIFLQLTTKTSVK